MCNCINDVNAKLADRNTCLTQAIVFRQRGNNPNLLLQTEQIETGRGKAKAVGMFLSYCPFCGEKYATGDEEASS